MFHISDHGDQHGPYPLEKLRKLRDNGLISAEALYWDDGTSEWCSLEEKLQQETVHAPAVAFEAATDLEAPATTGVVPPVIAMKPDRAFRAVDFGRRFLSFCIDGAWWSGLAILGSELARAINMWPYEGTFSLVAFGLGIIFRDALFGGRSLGRRLTSSHVLKHDSLDAIGPLKSMSRNLLATLLLIGPFLVAGLLGLLLGKVGEKAAAGVMLAGLIAVLKGAAGTGGQSWWDEMLGTVVVTKARPGDANILTPTL